MPRYNYECLDCLKKVIEDDKYSEFIDECGHLPLEVLEEEVMYETSHPIEPTKEELHEACECPRCGSHNAEKTYHGLNISSYTKGYGFLDRSGCYRDMNKYKLENDDPYGQYRSEGEVEHIKDKLIKGGKYDPKSKHFVNSSSDMEDTVKKVVDSPKEQ